MTDMYFILITKKEDWNLLRVPERFREGVKEKLIAEGYDEDGYKLDVE